MFETRPRLRFAVRTLLLPTSSVHLLCDLLLLMTFAFFFSVACGLALDPCRPGYSLAGVLRPDHRFGGGFRADADSALLLQ